MVTMDFGVKLPNDRHFPRIDTLELKHYMIRRLGRLQAEKYFNLLNGYLSFKVSKSSFDKLCIGLLGRENISLHNELIRAIIRNACDEKSSLRKYGKGQSSLNVFSQSSRRVRNPTVRECRSRDRLSPLGPHGKLNEDSVLKFPEQQSATEILSLGSRPPVEVTSVEEGEEVEQDSGSPGIHSRTSLRAPLGVYLQAKQARKRLRLGLSLSTDTCYKNGNLPDSWSLRKRLEQKLGSKRLNVSTDCANLLNNGLDMFMKRLLKSCLDLAASRVQRQVPSVSITDFQVAVQSNPWILGEDWHLQLEKVFLHASEDCTGG